MRARIACCLLVALSLADAIVAPGSRGAPRVRAISKKHAKEPTTNITQKNLRRVPRPPRSRPGRKKLWPPWRKGQKPRRIVVIREPGRKRFRWPWQPKPKTRIVVLRERIWMEGLRQSRRVQAIVEQVIKWWHMEQTIDHRWYNRALFLGSNAAYFVAGAGLLRLTRRRPESPPPLLAWLMFAACGYSSTYHAMQLAFGVESAQAHATGRADVFLAGMSSFYFFLECGCRTPLMRALALVSSLQFIDLLGLGYTTSHSLWHLFGAALSYAGGLQWTQDKRMLPRWSYTPPPDDTPPPPRAAAAASSVATASQRRLQALRRRG